jgi:putative RNA 2'-phosphotransferase
MKPDLVKVSKFLSYVLRHAPESIELALDANGWASIDALIAKAQAKGTTLTADAIREAVATNDKQRFALSEDGTRIRANQGHSIEVDLALAPQVPPDVLYHGTATRFVESIRGAGLVPGSRQHVHLSADRDTAAKVGTRHGVPIVLGVDARAMQADGNLFYRSENGVWLTAAVPARYLSIPAP